MYQLNNTTAIKSWISSNAHTLLLSRDQLCWFVSTPVVLAAVRAQNLSSPDALSERAVALYARAQSTHPHAHEHCHSETSVPNVVFPLFGE